MLRLLLLISIVLLPCTHFANDCVPQDATDILLCGKVVSRTYPGPPHFENVATGDRAEQCLILVLDSEQCFTIKTYDGKVITIQLTEIQLFADKETANKVQQFTGQHICVLGNIWSANNAHRRTGVLMTVKEIRKIA